jgi:hypothetical protein
LRKKHNTPRTESSRQWQRGVATTHCCPCPHAMRRSVCGGSRYSKFSARPRIHTQIITGTQERPEEETNPVTGGQLYVIGEVDSCGGIVDRDGRARSVRGSRRHHDLRCRGLGRRWRRRQEGRRHGRGTRRREGWHHRARNSTARGVNAAVQPSE